MSLGILPLLAAAACLGLTFTYRRVGRLAAGPLVAHMLLTTVVVALLPREVRLPAVGGMLVAFGAAIDGALRACRGEGEPDERLVAAIGRRGAAIVLGVALGVGPQPLHTFGWSLVLGMTSSLLFNDLLTHHLVTRWHKHSAT